jgi:type II secretory pathway pseudopilin PulG
VKKQGGFTIIEVSLFLAISAALLLLLSGLSGVVARQRFQDTIISLRSLIQDQYEEVRNGINERGSSKVCGEPDDTVAGTSGCLIVGKIMRFGFDEDDLSRVEISYISANSNIVGTNDLDVLKKTELGLVGSQDYQIKWGGEFVSMYDYNPRYAGDAQHGKVLNSGSESNIAIFRGPVSGNIIVASNIEIDRYSTSNSAGRNYISANEHVAIFIENGQSGFSGGALCLDGGSSSSGVKMVIPQEPLDKSPEDITNLNTICEGAI